MFVSLVLLVGMTLIFLVCLNQDICFANVREHSSDETDLYIVMFNTANKYNL